MPASRRASWFPFALGAIGAVGLAIRLLRVQEALQNPVFTRLFLDPAWYWAWSTKLMSRWTVGDASGSTAASALPPGPAWLLALTREAFGNALFAAYGVNACLGGLTVVLAGLLGLSLGGRAAGLISAAVVALCPVHIFWDATLLPQAAPAAALAGAVVLLVSFEGPRSRLASGLLLGVAALFRPDLLVAAGVAGVIAFFRDRSVPRAGVLLTGIALALAPATLRNLAVGGEAILVSDSAGQALYAAFNPASNAESAQDPGVAREPGARLRAYRMAAEKAVGHPLDTSSTSNFWASKAWERISGDGLEAARLVFGRTWSALATYEVPRVYDLQGHLRESKLLRHLPPLVVILPGLALLGLGTLLRARRWDGLLVGGVLLSAQAALVPFEVTSPDRMVVAALTVSLAAVGATTLGGWARTRRFKRSLLATAGVLLMGVVLSWDPFHGTFLLPDGWTRLTGTGARVASVAAFQADRRAAEEDAEVGRTYLDEGDNNNAAAWYLQAVTHDPNHAPSLTNLGLLVASAGKKPEGIALLKRSVLLEPDRFETNLNLCGLLAMTHDVAGATPFCEKALSLGPDRAEAHLEMAILHYNRGEISKAGVEVDTALRLDPDLAQARKLKETMAATAP